MKETGKTETRGEKTETADITLFLGALLLVCRLRFRTRKRGIPLSFLYDTKTISFEPIMSNQPEKTSEK